MSKESSTWLAYSDRAFPSADWREYLRAFNITWARTRSTGLVPVWYAIEGKGYVVWVSEPRWINDYWRISLAVSASAPPTGWTLVEEIVKSALVKFPAMRLERALGPDTEGDG
jgi:hypothetical protein